LVNLTRVQDSDVHLGLFFILLKLAFIELQEMTNQNLCFSGLFNSAGTQIRNARMADTFLIGRLDSISSTPPPKPPTE